MFTKLEENTTIIQFIGYVNKDIDIIRKNQKEIVKLKSRIIEILKIHQSLNIILKITKERINNTEDRAIEMILSEKKRLKKNIQRL